MRGLKVSDQLFHYTTHPMLNNIQIGEKFELNPGKQNAEGLGVYFAETPRIGAADAIAAGKKCTGCVVITRPVTQKEWWVTKKSLAEKFGRPRTWHTAGKSMSLTVEKIVEEKIFCTWSWV